MEPSFLLKLILDQEEYINGLEYNDERYGHFSLTEFSANIILVLQGGRLSYLPGLPPIVENYLIPLVLDHEPTLIALQHPTLILLKKNYDLIVNILSEQIDHRINLGKVLGYGYIGLDFLGINKDVYYINYDLKDGNENIKQLYGFTIPVEKYNSENKRKAVEDLIKYQNILGKYGYEVVLSCIFRAKGSRGSVEIPLP